MIDMTSKDSGGSVVRIVSISGYYVTQSSSDLSPSCNYKI